MTQIYVYLETNINHKQGSRKASESKPGSIQPNGKQTKLLISATKSQGSAKKKTSEVNEDFELVDVDQEIVKKVRLLIEYFIELSVIVFPLQKYPSSIVGCA